MTQNKARRTNEIDFLHLPWAQKVWRFESPRPDHFLTDSIGFFEDLLDESIELGIHQIRSLHAGFP